MFSCLARRLHDTTETLLQTPCKQKKCYLQNDEELESQLYLPHVEVDIWQQTESSIGPSCRGISTCIGWKLKLSEYLETRITLRTNLIT